MFNFLAIVHIIASIIMITFILLQDPKGGAMGMFGGGSSSLFGSTGANQFLLNVTKWTAIIFAATSIYLAALSSQKSTSVIDTYTPNSSPEQPEGSSQPAVKPDTSREDTSPAPTPSDISPKPKEDNSQNPPSSPSSKPIEPRNKLSPLQNDNTLNESPNPSPPTKNQRSHDQASFPHIINKNITVPKGSKSFLLKQYPLMNEEHFLTINKQYF